MTETPLRTLNLVGDGDETDLLAALERAFGVRFADADTAGCVTVGDLFEVLKQKAPPHEGDGRCASAMTFYRLRDALTGQAPRDKILPSAKLAEIVRLPPHRFHAELERRTGLHVPMFHFAWLGNAGVTFAFLGGLGLVALALLRSPIWPAMLSFIAGVVMMYADQRRLPDVTLGDFARELSMLNVATLSQGGARTTEDRLWNAYLAVLRGEIGVKGVIVRSTRLFG
jgi:hypothetical protein